MRRLSNIKKIRLHHEGTNTLVYGFFGIAAISLILYYLLRNYSLVPLYVFLGIAVILYLVAVNFFRCPIRIFGGNTENIIVAPADGKVVVAEEVEELEYFHDKRKMVSIFMSVTNVHANWFPCDGFVKLVEHQSGNFHKAWLPKASIENERSTVVIETPSGEEILVRQIAGAVARRIVTYAKPDEECYIDQHLGFIKFGSRVDVFLPLSADIKVAVGQATVGNHTIVAELQAAAK